MQTERSIIFERTVDAVSTTILVASLYFLAAGHNRPGGGFIGGLVAGCALVLRALTGRRDTALVSRLDPLTLMGVGVATAALTAMASLLGGGSLLDGGKVVLNGLPVFGDVTLYSVLVFDTGVYLGVVGLIGAEIGALGPGTDTDTDSDVSDR